MPLNKETKSLNYIIVSPINQFWRPDQLETRCGRENQHPERLGPQALGWAAQENGKETQLWPIEWGSVWCRSFRSPTPSHTQPFQIKWEVYFSKNCVARFYCVVVMILHAYVLYVSISGYEFTTAVIFSFKLMFQSFSKNVFNSLLFSLFGKNLNLFISFRDSSIFSQAQRLDLIKILSNNNHYLIQPFKISGRSRSPKRG